MISYMPLMRVLDKRGMTLTDLELKLNLSQSSLRQVMNKGQYLRISTLLKIAEVLECGVEDLISWKKGEGVEGSSKYVEIDWQKLSNLCRENGTSLSGVSAKIGCTQKNFSLAKARNSKLPPIDVEKICEALNVSKEQFVL